MKEIEYCNDCKFCKKLQKTSGYYYDTYCMYGKDENEVVSNGKLVQSWSFETTKVIKPIHCPLIKRNRLPIDYQLWKSITPITNWDDIEVGKVYHVPPVNGEKRMDVKVITKSQYMMNVKVLSGSNNGTTISFYPESLRCKFFIENKIVEYISKQA